jgi:flagellar biogenesis protein FliO
MAEMHNTTSKLALAITLLLPAAAIAEPAPSAPASAPAPAPAPAAAAAPAAPRPIAAPAAPTAIRPPSFELLDRGDAVEVIVRNAKAARTAIIPVRSRLQVQLAGAPTARRVVPGDPTVKLIELDTQDATRMLSVKLGFAPADVKALARFAQAIQVGDDLHLLVPRTLPAEGAAPRLPDPTLSPELAAAVARIDPTRPILGPQLEPARTREAPDRAATTADALAPQPPRPVPAADARPAPKADPAIGATGPTGIATAAAPATPERAGNGKPLARSLAADADDSWANISMYAALGLAVVAVGIWLMRRRRGNTSTPATIEVIAQRSLGGKARIVWLSAGPREMLVSVTPQQVRMLGQWRKAEVATALPGAYTHNEVRPTREPTDERSAGPDARASDRPLSPAVTGILRLRGRTGQMAAVTDEAAAGDVVADELWAKEILAATGARR